MPPLSVRVLTKDVTDDVLRVVVYGASEPDQALLRALPGATSGPADAVTVTFSQVAGAALSKQVHDAISFAVACRRVPISTFHTPAGPIRVDPPLVMGVLNVTPDSFFDGGKAYQKDAPDVAIAAGLALHGAGAAVVDVGGESTRPGAKPVSVAEELDRVVPVVTALAHAGVTVSIDTRKAAVAKACVAAGAAIVNDVSAGLYDPDMFATVIGLDAGYVLMHMQGTPETMQQNPSYTDVRADVFTFLAGRIDAFVAAGGSRDRLVVDPGIGFGKRVEDNVSLLTGLDELHALGVPVLVGVSHKSVLGALTGHTDPGKRHAASIAAHALAVHAGAQIVRAHDVAACVDALAVAHALRR
jgi:dihydropteroate synthase